MTESTKAYAREVLQAATQHVLNIADLVDGTAADRLAAVDHLDSSCKNILQVLLIYLPSCDTQGVEDQQADLYCDVQNSLASQAEVGMRHLSSLQTPIYVQRHPRAFYPAGEC